MPGHKGRCKFLLRLNACKLDVTELKAIDNEKIVRDAEIDCQKILGARHLRFLTDGSTSGIFSMLYAVKDMGDELIINRTAHKSVYNALKLLGIAPVVVDGRALSGAEQTPSVEITERVLDAHPNAIGVLYTYPDYYGREYQIENLSALLKKRGKLLIIDGAHGGHYKFIGNAYAGDFADLWVDGAHKTMPTLNQGAIVCTSREDLIRKLDEGVGIFSTTSPSYPILASVEYGVKYTAQKCAKTHDNFLGWLNKLKTKLTKLGLWVMEKTDPYKLSVDFGGAGYRTDEIENLLIKKGVHAEMNDKRHILFMFSVLTSLSDLKRLYRAIKYAVSLAQKSEPKQNDKIPVGERVMPYLQAVNAENEYIPLLDAENRISAENIGKFPPCYPLVVAGERVTGEVIRELDCENTFGIKDGKIKVVKEK